jgi:hypothetical protein
MPLTLAIAVASRADKLPVIYFAVSAKELAEGLRCWVAFGH